jgi:putative transposase
MARTIRLDSPGTYYHVLARGNGTQTVFHKRSDYEMFLDLLHKAVKRFSIEIHGYVVMSNHYHLLIKTRQANLSRAVQWLGVSYAGWYNREYKQSGHVFQGRFKSFLIENDRYLTALCYYIHGNPLRAGRVKNVPAYAWSSYHAYADGKHRPKWLTTDVVLGMCGGSRKKFIGEQDAYVRKAESALDALHHGLCLGSEDFAEECARRLQGEDLAEKPQLRQLYRGKNVRTRAVEILKYLGGEEAVGMTRAGSRKNRPLRDTGMYVLQQTGLYSNKEIGEVFGVGYTAVTEAVRRTERFLQTNRVIAAKVRKILES